MRPGSSVRNVLLAASLVCLGACAAPPPPASPGVPPEVEATIGELLEKQPEARRLLEEAHAYAVFPRVARFAFGFGGASGTGVFVEQGRVVGHVKQAEFIHGVSFGAELYREVIFFRDPEIVESFKQGSLEFRGRAGGAVGPGGLSTDSAFPGGVAVVRMTRQGLMIDVSVAATKFVFTPASSASVPPPP